MIARPFVGKAGAYKRTYNRKDFSLVPPSETALDRLAGGGNPGRGHGEDPRHLQRAAASAAGIHTEGNTDGLARTRELLGEVKEGMIFVNLVDTDMLYGHRNDVPGLPPRARGDRRGLPGLFARMGPKDVLAITADHGCDPTMPSHRPFARVRADPRLRSPRPRGRLGPGHARGPSPTWARPCSSTSARLQNPTGELPRGDFMS